jgi:hypothetical protein
MGIRPILDRWRKHLRTTRALISTLNSRIDGQGHSHPPLRQPNAVAQLRHHDERRRTPPNSHARVAKINPRASTQTLGNGEYSRSDLTVNHCAVVPGHGGARDRRNVQLWWRIPAIPSARSGRQGHRNPPHGSTERASRRQHSIDDVGVNSTAAVRNPWARLHPQRQSGRDIEARPPWLRPGKAPW